MAMTARWRCLQAVDARCLALDFESPQQASAWAGQRLLNVTNLPEKVFQIDLEETNCLTIWIRFSESAAAVKV